MAKKYCAKCKSHDWGGPTRDTRTQALSDLDAHIVEVDGNHDGEIIELDG